MWGEGPRAFSDSLSIDRDHDAANIDNFIREFTKPEILVPGMLPESYGKSAADGIRWLAGMHTAPNIPTMEPKMHAKIEPAPELKRPWYRKLLGFLLVRWYLRRKR